MISSDRLKILKHKEALNSGNNYQFMRKELFDNIITNIFNRTDQHIFIFYDINVLKTKFEEYFKEKYNKFVDIYGVDIATHEFVKHFISVLYIEKIKELKDLYDNE
jgi:hypothetical protein